MADWATIEAERFQDLHCRPDGITLTAGARVNLANTLRHIADERVKQADKLASEIHDAIYAEPFDRQVASDAVWKLHELLRSNPQAEMRKDDD